MLLQSIICDEYICNKVISLLGSDGIRLHVKAIQVLKTIVVACLTCVSNLADLAAVKSILQRVCRDMETAMIAQGRHKQYLGQEFPEFVLSRRPMKEPDVPEKYKVKGMTEDFR